MKKVLILVLIILLSFSFYGCNKRQAEDKAIYVMTFNIRNITTEPSPERRWRNRKELVLETIMLSSPDIIGLQEVKKEQYEYLMENLVGYEHYAENTWGEDNPLGAAFGGYNVVFYNKERFSLLEKETLWLSDTPEKPSICFGADNLDFRTLTKVLLEDKLNGKITTVINTHLPYKGALPMQKSSEMLARVAADIEGAIIVMGDFNYQQDRPLYDIVTSQNLSDCKKLTDSFDEGGTFNSFVGYIDKPWPLPIDFILINDTYFNVISHKINRHHSKEGYCPSDHYPVEVILEYS